MEAAFAEHTVAEWRELLADFTGQWCVVQDTLEAARSTRRPSPTATCRTAQTACGHAVPSWWPHPCSSAANRRRRAGRPNSTSTATPSSKKLGIDWDTIVDLKVRSVVG